MRVPLEWLRAYCAPDLDPQALATRLALTGTEVERIEHHGPPTGDGYLVGTVLDAHQHPNAERLWVCEVDLGDGRTRQIVCGAPNVNAGQTVAVAQPGAVLPDGRTLTKATLRGVESDGMILAEDELAIGTDHQRILTLDGAPAQPGTPLNQVIAITTDVLVLEITPNRPDCLGIYGVAREVHAATDAPLKPPPWDADPGTRGSIQKATVTVETPKELCLRFTARVFEDVRIGPSPPWLKARLMAAGQRPISNVVDITNYAMLVTGQPLHAFDLDRVAGQELTVRNAQPGETMRTLDGQLRTLDERMVLIADAYGPTSIAGIMGGERSEVSENTTRVLLEVATWNGPNIHRTALTLGLRSEASGRFEKQLQPEQALEAQALATTLMLELTGAQLASGTIDIGGPGPPPITIRLRDARVKSLLGAEVPRTRSEQILQALQFETAQAPDGLDVKPPPFRRGDIQREADLIEEVARIDGVDKLPATLPSRHGASGRLTVRQRLRRQAADALAAQGLDEVLGWSFAAPDFAQRLRMRNHRAVELLNPMSSAEAELRTTLLGSLLDVAARNRARGVHALRLFELGAVYLPGEQKLPHEPHHAAALLGGPTRPPTWREQAPAEADFFAAKGVLHGLLDRLRASWSVERSQQPFLHPGRAAAVKVAGSEVGWVGEIHPLVLAEWDLSGTVAGFELDLDATSERLPGTARYEDLTSFPSVREDLAVIVPETVSAKQVVDTIRRAGEPLLKLVEVFDAYRDRERIGQDNVSLALHLEFRAPERTLTDEEVAERRRKIGEALQEQLGGKVREA
jgi:phenylalanyl-tRNA synthetase beta chain